MMLAFYKQNLDNVKLQPMGFFFKKNFWSASSAAFAFEHVEIGKAIFIDDLAGVFTLRSLF